MCEIYSKLIIKLTKRLTKTCSGVSNAEFEKVNTGWLAVMLNSLIMELSGVNGVGYLHSHRSYYWIV